VDEDSLQKKRTRGREAEELLANPLLLESFEKIEVAIKKSFDQVNMTPEDAHTVWITNQLYRRLRLFIEKTARGVKDAELEMSIKRATHPLEPAGE
jgi:hypothetical protein|tara:strand:- start:9872 stop:10159 length:288 start_codon:yes stop_codon:yes gene_type:complete